MMSKITIGIGTALVLLGVGFYFGTDRVSPTALIPAFVGLPVLILGLVALNGGEAARKHCAHFAVMITMLGAIGGLVRGIMAFAKADETRPVNTAAATATLMMAALCIVHVVFSVRSFIAARKAREAAAQ